MRSSGSHLICRAPRNSRSPAVVCCSVDFRVLQGAKCTTHRAFKFFSMASCLPNSSRHCLLGMIKTSHPSLTDAFAQETLTHAGNSDNGHRSSVLWNGQAMIWIHCCSHKSAIQARVVPPLASSRVLPSAAHFRNRSLALPRPRHTGRTRQSWPICVPTSLPASSQIVDFEHLAAQKAFPDRKAVFCTHALFTTGSSEYGPASAVLQAVVLL